MRGHTRSFHPRVNKADHRHTCRSSAILEASRLSPSVASSEVAGGRVRNSGFSTGDVRDDDAAAAVAVAVAVAAAAAVEDASVACSPMSSPMVLKSKMSRPPPRSGCQ